MTHKGSKYKINIGSLASDIYAVLYFEDSTMRVQRFVKE